MVHYCEKLMGVVVFAKVQGHLKYNHEKINESGETATSDTPTFADGV